MRLWSTVVDRFRKPMTAEDYIIDEGATAEAHGLVLESMVQREGYWVPRDDSLIVDVVDHLGACRHGSVDPDRLRGWGIPGVRFGCSPWKQGCDRVMVTFGGHHHDGDTPTLLMDLDMAQELAELLMAAVVDGRITKGAALESVPFVDITLEPCGCEVPPSDLGEDW